MLHPDRPFADRRDAGRRLAAELTAYARSDPLVLALPRGGVPVAFEVAGALGASLDVLLVRKLGAPGNPELGIGAVVEGDDPEVVLNDDVLDALEPSARYLEAETQRQLAEIQRRRAAYLGDRRPVPTRGRTVILVDDGIATGATARVALKVLRRTGAARIVLAVPVAPRGALDALAAEADAAVCLLTPEPFRAVGLHYADFDQTADEEVVDLLRMSRAPGGPERESPGEAGRTAGRTSEAVPGD